MSALAEDRLDDRPANTWLPKLLMGIALVVFLGGGWWFLSHMKGGDGPHRQVSRIALLPDTPPPPPPPPKDEKKPEPPKDEPKQVVHEEQIKQAEAPKAAEPIKMEGAAGDGPSAFGSGAVKNDYAGGAPLTGPGGTGTGADRAQERFYANSARQLLRDEIERRLKGEGDQLVATFAVWVGKGGEIERFELTPSGNAGNDAALRTALEETSHQFKLPPPPAITRPMRFRLSVRPQG